MPNGPFSSKYAPSPSPKYAPGGRGLPTLCWIYSSLTKFDTLIRSIRDMQGQGLHHLLISCQSHFYAKPFHPLCQFHLYEIYWLTLVSVFICTNIHSDIAATSTSFSAMYVAEKRKELLLLLLCRSSLLLLCRSSYFYFYVESATYLLLYFYVEAER